MALSKGTTEYKEIRLVLLGKTGCGKSATGNTILQKPVAFESRNSAQSVTKMTDCKNNIIDDVFVKVVDTPGFFDTSDVLTTEQLDEEVVRCIGLSTPGPHAFLYVINCERLTQVEMQTTQKILDLFGDDIYNFMIITLVSKNGLDKDQTIQQYIDTFPLYFQQLLTRCKGRRIVVDNKGTDHDKNEFVFSLFKMVTTMNKGQYYSNEMLRNAQIAIKNRKAELLIQNPSLQREQLNDIIDTELLTGGSVFKMMLRGIVGATVSEIIKGAAHVAMGAASDTAKDLCTIS